MAYYNGSGDMMYGRGDYYQGDYYQGDPFSLGGLIKGAVGGILGGPIGIASGALKGAFAPSARPPTGTSMIVAPPPGMPVLQRPGGGGAGIGYFAPGGGGVGIGYFGPGPGGPSSQIVPSLNGRMRGMHYNHSTYVTRGGGTSHWPVGLQVHPKGTVQVPNRHMNYGNSRALRRALRRARGFARLARSAGFITRHYKKPSSSKKKR